MTGQRAGDLERPENIMIGGNDDDDDAAFRSIQWKTLNLWDKPVNCYSYR